MKKHILAATVLTAGLLVSACATSSTEFSMNELPTNVRMTVAEQVEDGTIESIHRHNDEGVQTYRVEYEIDGEEWELRVNDYGEVIEHNEA